MVAYNEYYLINLIVHCKKSHYNDVFINCLGKVNTGVITIGWEFHDPEYSLENKMRYNIVRVITQPRYKELSRVVVENKPPRYVDTVTVKTLTDLSAGFDLNQNQKDSILSSLNTENFNLIMGKNSFDLRHAWNWKNFCNLIASLLYGSSRKESVSDVVYTDSSRLLN